MDGRDWFVFRKYSIRKNSSFGKHELRSGRELLTDSSHHQLRFDDQKERSDRQFEVWNRRVRKVFFILFYRIVSFVSVASCYVPAL